MEHVRCNICDRVWDFLDLIEVTADERIDEDELDGEEAEDAAADGSIYECPDCGVMDWNRL